MKITYKVGDVIEYRTFDGKLRKVKVTNKESNIKNGRAGFDGEMSDGDTVWGYDDQITRILTEEPSITCPLCGRTSYNSNDIRERYCGACHKFWGDPQL